MEIKKILDDIAPALPATLDTVSSIFVEGVAGAIIPGVGNIMISYKQRQQEQRFELAIKEIQRRQDEIDEILKNYQDEMLPQMQKLLEIYLDYSIENNQKEKIELLSNGYINSIKIENPQEDVLLGFYDTFLLVNMLDIRVLNLYAHNTILEDRDNYTKIMNDYNIDYSQYHMIQMKLARLGLLENRNDNDQDKNIEFIIDYLQAVDKNKANDAKRALNRIKKVSKHDRYIISSYGRNFLNFFNGV